MTVIAIIETLVTDGLHIVCEKKIRDIDEQQVSEKNIMYMSRHLKANQWFIYHSYIILSYVVYLFCVFFLM